MSKSDRLARFIFDVSDTPVANRRQGYRDRKASMLRRGLAIGFFLGLLASVGLWIYDRMAARTESAA